MPNNMQDNVGGFKFNFRKSIHEIKYFNEESAAKHFNLVGPKIMEDNRIQLKNFIDCLKSTDKNILIPLTIQFPKLRGPSSGSGYGPGSVDSHANMLVYRRDTNKLEHFEPHGKDFLGNLLISNYIERILQSIVGSINAYNVKTSYSLFKTPMELVEGYLVCPNVKGFQTIQEEFKTYDREGDGFCVMWSFFFQEMVLLNPDLTSKEVMTEIFEIVNRKDGPKFLTNIIRGYVVIVGQQIKLYLNQFINTGFTIENIAYAIKMNDQLKLNIPKSPNNTIFIIAPIGDFQSYLFNLIFVIINSIYSNDQFVLTHSKEDVKNELDKLSKSKFIKEYIKNQNHLVTVINHQIQIYNDKFETKAKADKIDKSIFAFVLKINKELTINSYYNSFKYILQYIQLKIADKYYKSISPATPSSPSPFSPLLSKKRLASVLKKCPNGTRRNKNTGNCEPKIIRKSLVSSLVPSLAPDASLLPEPAFSSEEAEEQVLAPVQVQVQEQAPDPSLLPEPTFSSEEELVVPASIPTQNIIKTKHRCPNGTHRNKKTGNCDAYVKI